jgi:outer membrane protein TolC
VTRLADVLPSRPSASDARRSAPTACAIVGTAVLLLAAPVAAQAPRDTLTLDVLHRMAEAADPRAEQSALLARQSALRTATLDRERWRPQLGATATGQYLSDVPRIALPGALGPLSHQYDAYATARQPLLDPSWRARADAERARASEAEAALRAALWQQRQQVNDAFFGILLRRAQQRTIEASIEDLGVRRRLAVERVAAGVALPSEVALLDAEIARRRQSLDEARADADAARAVLASLIGRPVPPDALLELPEAPPALPAPSRDRPEFAQFAQTRAALEARAEIAAAQQRPRLALVGRAGYGRPGLNVLGREFDTYYVAGVQLDWSPWTWGATRREREEQALQQRIVATSEAAFAEGLARTAAVEQVRIAALERAIAVDAEIIALRGRVLDETRRRHDEGDVTAADYAARQAELLVARLEHDTHRVRLAEARARYLTTIGREVR